MCEECYMKLQDMECPFCKRDLYARPKEYPDPAADVEVEIEERLPRPRRTVTELYDQIHTHPEDFALPHDLQVAIHELRNANERANLVAAPWLELQLGMLSMLSHVFAAESQPSHDPLDFGNYGLVDLNLQPQSVELERWIDEHLLSHMHLS